MKLSKRRKLCVGVMVLGLVALAVDRTLLSPDEPENLDAAAAMPVTARASLVGGDALERGLGVLSVGQRLEQFRQTREGAGISDAFAAVGGWFEKTAQRPAPTESAERAHEFKLTSVSGKSGNIASVNGTVLKVGQEKEVVLDKDTAAERRVLVTLLSVDWAGRRAVIETNGQKLDLAMAGPENDRN